MIEGGRQTGKAGAELGAETFDFSTGGQEYGNATACADETPHRAVVQEFRRLLARHRHLRLQRRIERTGLQHFVAAEVAAIDRWIDRRREPDETGTNALAERETELEFGRRLVDLVHDNRVAPGDQIVGQPPPGDPGRDDDNVPLRCLGCGLTFAIHDAHQQRRVENLLGDQADAERLAGARAGDDTEGFPLASPLPHGRPVLALEQGVDVGMQCQLDRFACRPRRRDNDDAPARVQRVPVGVDIEREEVIADGEHGRKLAGKWMSSRAPRGIASSRIDPSVAPLLRDDKAPATILSRFTEE